MSYLDDLSDIWEQVKVTLSEKFSPSQMDLCILGAVSTAVNMISGIVTRCVNAIERNKSEADRAKGHLGRNAIFTLIFTGLAFGIAQFGLQAVIAKGYAYLGYAAMITLFIPFVFHAIKTGMKEI